MQAWREVAAAPSCLLLAGAAALLLELRAGSLASEASTACDQLTEKNAPALYLCASRLLASSWGCALLIPPRLLPLHSTTCRDKLAKGEEVDDDLADLADPDLLAEAAASHKLAEAAAAAEAEEAGIDLDPYGAGALNDSGAPGLEWGADSRVVLADRGRWHHCIPLCEAAQATAARCCTFLAHDILHLPARPGADDDFDIDKERAGEEADLVPEEKPPEWDIDMPVQAAPFNVMLTCYTLFERDRCGLAGAICAAAGVQEGTGGWSGLHRTGTNSQSTSAACVA